MKAWSLVENRMDSFYLLYGKNNAMLSYYEQFIFFIDGQRERLLQANNLIKFVFFTMPH